MPEISKGKILAGREAIGAYRIAHTALYATNPHRRSIPEEHRPLINKLSDKLHRLGFNSIGIFFGASDDLNREELGFSSREDWEARHSIADMNAFGEKWR